ncbi:ribosome alternative rescue factor ArfA [Bacillus subtilis]|uniref:ribosome alternative rescue factor ArfA n=1 Tax=Bacillus subtilis TaxID=1423 RepID=UPI0021D97C1D|nr:ribosome alternative rescue factor ArfA [Bacillus subtilis]
MKRKTVNTIGEMTNSRMAWNFNASTRVVQNKKGKGSYNRKRMKQKQTKEFL